MIRILMSETQKTKIEKIYWDWIKKYHLNNLISVIEKDDNMKKLVMQGETDLHSALEKFFLANHTKLAGIKISIDKMRGRNENIKSDTKDYLIARYINYRDSQAAKIVNVLEMYVCPYCNQNHLNVVYEKTGKVRFWGDLDHFYDKSTYPELSVCLYNLIPVCKVCNQLKASQKSDIISPYNYEIKSSIKFKTEFDEKFDLDYLRGKSQNFNIVIDRDQLKREDEIEIELLDLENRYKHLKQNVQEIIIKAKAYDSIYQKQLKEVFGLSNEELDSFLFGYTENHLDRILSKFNMDILNEFRN